MVEQWNDEVMECWELPPIIGLDSVYYVIQTFQFSTLPILPLFHHSTLRIFQR